MSKYITEGGDLLGAFPYSLARDEDKEKLAESISDELARTAADTEKALIFPEIDTLPEDLLDLLAVDFKIDWYDVESPVWNKRQTVKECILVHKYKGTKFAVETALHSMFLSAEVQEWFEYNGEPYHFKIVVYGSTSSNLKKLNSKLLYAKNLRSVMDTVKFVLIPDPINTYAGAAIAGQAVTKKTELKTDDDGVFSSDGKFYFGAAFVNQTKEFAADMSSTDDAVFSVSERYVIGLGITNSKTKHFNSKLIIDCGKNEADSFGGLVSAGSVSSYSKRFVSSLIYTADVDSPIPCSKAYVSGTAKGFAKKMRLEVDFK
ncbi:MAG: phage tail protein I [Lachnospiraceae bacterium]|nr:phage tail protein I [Lachnospiraceae bacterium]